MDEIYFILRGLSFRKKMKVLGYLEGELLHIAISEDTKKKKIKLLNFQRKIKKAVTK